MTVCFVNQATPADACTGVDDYGLNSLSVISVLLPLSIGLEACEVAISTQLGHVAVLGRLEPGVMQRVLESCHSMQGADMSVT